MESQKRLFNGDELHKDPFEISAEDMVDAAPVFNVINVNEVVDIDIDWYLVGT